MKPTMTHAELRAAIEDAAALPPRLALTFRPMFGGQMIYAAGRPFASLAEPGLSVKLGGAEREALLREPGSGPLQHEGEGPSKQYVIVPGHIVEDTAQLRAWLDRSIAFVATLPQPRRKRAGAGSVKGTRP